MHLAIEILHLLDDGRMLAAQDELFGQLDGLPIGSEALEVVAGWAGHAL